MNVNHIMRKEVKELLTPATILPIVVMAIILASMGNMVGNVEEKASETPIVGFIDEDNSAFSKIAASVLDEHARVVYNFTGKANMEEALEKVQENDGLALLIITSDFSENILESKPGVIEIQWIMKGAGIMDSISSGVVENLIRLIDREISKELIEDNVSVSSTIVLNPTTKNETTFFKGKEMKGLSPGTIGALLSTQSMLIPIVMMMLIIMAGGMVISSMGMEKENKTLETLLTLPVRRSSIVVGKIVGSALVGLLMAVIYMFGFGYYMRSFQQSGINLEEFGLALGMQDYLLVGISLFVTLLAGLSLCMVLGTFAKNYKSAQALTFPVAALAMIPMFLIMFKDFDTLPIALKIVLFAIPFSHPMMAMRALMFDNYLLVIGGIVYVTIFAMVTIAVAVWIFKTDKLLTGSVRKMSFGKIWKIR
ncbi:MAG: ABC transporter permease [Candidatus Methanofastidiosia archaeon]